MKDPVSVLESRKDPACVKPCPGIIKIIALKSQDRSIDCRLEYEQNLLEDIIKLKARKLDNKKE